MEHEVFVPVPAEVLRATLADPARLARCVPGFQQDADAAAGPLAGRLKVRVGGNTITYRGAWHVTERPGGFAVEGEGAEVRGKGTVTCGLTVALGPLAGGTTLGFTGSVTATGRLADAAEEARNAAGARMLDRFAEALAAVADVEAELAAEGTGEGTGAGVAAGATAGEATDDKATDDEATDDEAAVDDDGVDDDGVDDGVEEPGGHTSVFDTPVPPPSLDPRADEDFGKDADADTDAGKNTDGDGSAPAGGPAKNGSPATRTPPRRTASGTTPPPAGPAGRPPRPRTPGAR
ncbi:hypothetical protein SLA_3481 [Streptomyces laurentii]|uniref:Carbon monoxide dehydrogenase subunit G n=1 Tax=Streptomyces laurentii TaxID=39478 RepID=A0A160P1Y2_STRLU|nr:hypothetical protein SLA_3481 [Streptomyces laurentii]